MLCRDTTWTEAKANDEFVAGDRIYCTNNVVVHSSSDVGLQTIEGERRAEPPNSFSKKQNEKIKIADEQHQFL
eukprot:1687098-Amphidinium_carterae.1